jgi:hypothetical protein
MPKRASTHPLWVFIPKGTPIAHNDRGYFDPESPDNQTQDDCTAILYRHKRYGKWADRAFTGHDGVPGARYRVYIEVSKCVKLKDGGAL